MLQRTIFEKFLRCPNLAAVMIPDEAATEFLEAKNPQLRDRIRYLPDIGDVPELIDNHTAKIELGLPQRSKVVLSFGTLSARKGIQELMQALSDPRCPTNVIGLLVGEADWGAQGILGAVTAIRLLESNRLFWLRGFADEQLTRLAFSAADIAWLGYKDFLNSSGFLWQCVRSELPILACREGLIGRLVQRHQLGLTISPDNREEVLPALNALMEDRQLRLRIQARCRVAGASHSPESFGMVLCSVLE
jgi:glycosyltransferase involved in cell wall biosynthesis